MSSFDKEEHAKLTKALDTRFPHTQIVVRCFSTVDEIETKILRDEGGMIFYGNCRGEIFIVNNGKSDQPIRYCDVIDSLIRNDYIKIKSHQKILKDIYISPCDLMQIYRFKWE